MADDFGHHDWPSYEEVRELFAELDLGDDDLDRANLIIEDHVGEAQDQAE
ncbi:hypothetical protein [Nocardia macrotermitis]|uniref:Uncharacterized protein n=1 Tax=Nocardia macrotermitis TaxID=2585198 RepID=A0A7K0DEK4_9NOCA|nr:hypothetical protein [Nocardia macrotermitis]MQY23941.1 hypothetical protein [Nocardia macrotermitis]